MKKILIANRGEIALRVMRTAREMGIKTVAVYSEADRQSPHVKYADEAIFIGPPPSNQSYLVMDKIMEACQITGADAIHPGYGFLSENATFARKVKEAGIIFIGPSAEAMDLMGDKLSAKSTAKKYNIPLVPGTDTAITDAEEARTIAENIGFPVLIKASAGGGGKGMRTVERTEDFLEQLQMAQGEALSSFGDSSVFIERYVASPRHIEIQIMADNHGHVCYLFERECSIQRRHQKVIEEAPSSVLTPEIRKAMGECAVQVAKACNYSGAGTVEFLLDEHLNFYFLEMNTRLQVEHPVTEMITGIDLVKEQIQVARNEKLSFKQEDLSINGHSIEVRVYAEDPANNFLPNVGKLEVYNRPSGNGVRVDDGFEQGMDIPIFYDPMISKLIVHAENREAAIEKMNRAIDDYQIQGVETTLSFCKFAINHQAFKSGNFDTHFVKHFFKPELLEQQPSLFDDQLAALFSAYYYEKVIAKKQNQTTAQAQEITSNWRKNRLYNA